MRYGCAVIVVVTVSFFLGCASAPRQPVTIKHAPIPSMGQAVSLKQKGKQETKETKETKMPPDEGIAALVSLLEAKNLISPDEGKRIIETSEKQAGLEKKQVVETVRKEMGEEVPKAIEKAAAPEWTKRITLRGDIRLRYEKDLFDKNNADFLKPEKPTELMNTKIDQDRLKYRLRFGAQIQVNEQLDAVILLSSGNINTPISTNTLLGDYLNKDNVVIDLAYLAWHRDIFTLSAGRIPNPWFSPTTLVWDDDLNFEGIALDVRKRIWRSWTPFFIAGAFPLDSYEFSKRDKWMVGMQAGIDRAEDKGLSFGVGAAYYHFSNITGRLNDPLRPGETDWTAPQYQQKGNTLFNISATPGDIKTALAAEFREVALSASLDVGFWDPYHIVIFGDYVKNIGFDRADVAERTGNPEQPEDTIGYQMGLSVGHAKVDRWGAWRAYLQYRYIEADAVVDAFTDSDFHLGGTNAKGWIIGSEIGLLKNCWLSLRWLTADEIGGPPLAIDVFFLDLNARF